MHWHLDTGYSEEEPFITLSLYEAIGQAASELETIADHAYETISIHGENALFEDAYNAFTEWEQLRNLAENAANIWRNATVKPADRAPLFQEEDIYLADGSPNANTALYATALHVLAEINEKSPLAIWDDTTFDVAYADDNGNPAGEDDPYAHMTCAAYLS